MWQRTVTTQPTPKRTAATPLIPNTDPAVSPNLTAGLLLAALPYLVELGLPAPTTTAVLEATGAGRTRAYELRAALEELLPTLLREPGRPGAVPATPVDTTAITCAITDYLIAHPGAAATRGSRREYSDGFRAEALEQMARHPELDRAQVAEAIRIPRATLDDWLAAATPAAETANEPRKDEDPIATGRIATLLHAWRRWDGGFAAFGAHVREQLDIPWGDTRIGKVLSVHSNRRPRKRPGRRPDEKALRSAFLSFFPGAQWTLDGSPITITWCGEPFTFNWELVVDTASAACVGADVRPTENTAAVIAAYQDAVTTAGDPPLALNTDNATENDGPGMAEALGDTLHIRATKGRPQNDCHAEGGFGLFQNSAPPLVVQGDTPRQRAHAVLVLLLTIWMRALNHRPRKTCGGRSRVDLYQNAHVTPEQVDDAKKALAAIHRRHDQADRTRNARLHPTARALLDAFFEDRGWDDPLRRIRDAIAGYPIDAIIGATAIFEGKDASGRLPEDVGPRYLLGITRNLADEREGAAIAEALWRRRLDARDHILARLVADRDAVEGHVRSKLDTFTQNVLGATSTLQRMLWQDAIAQAIRAEHLGDQKAHFDRLTRTVHAAYRIRQRERLAIVRGIAERIVPLN